MDPLGIAAALLQSRSGSHLLSIGVRCAYRDSLRHFAVRHADRMLRSASNGDLGVTQGWRAIARQRVLLALAIVHTLDRAIARGWISQPVARRVAELWGRALSLPPDRQAAGLHFKREHGCGPPWFVVISPGHDCNLRCDGCYASSGVTDCRLEWPVFDRIISEARQLWGAPLVVLSGGEPLAYRSEDRDVLDAVEKHSDCMFLMFTNGTLIDKAIAQRLARLGNLTPAISIEGLRETTDLRRGAGVFELAVRAMQELRSAGVPFGVSLTATRQNSDQILCDELLDHCFERQGAFYGFIFHYMPIGRCPSLQMVPTPEQRLRLWRRTWEVIEQRQVFLFDFWNSGPLVEGCIAAGREGGYFHIDWNGRVMPCVFAPYSVANIHDVYAAGGTLEDVWRAPLFEAIRGWQRAYGFGGAQPSVHGNWLRPCPMRDHHAVFREWVERYQAEPEDDAAQQSLRDEDLCRGLVEYGTTVGRLTQGIWEREYLGKESRP